MVHLLVDRYVGDPDIGAKLDESVTPLVLEARDGRLRVMEFLQKRGANVDREVLPWLMLKAHAIFYTRDALGNALAMYLADSGCWSGLKESFRAKAMARALSEVGALPELIRVQRLRAQILKGMRFEFENSKEWAASQVEVTSMGLEQANEPGRVEAVTEFGKRMRAEGSLEAQGFFSSSRWPVRLRPANRQRIPGANPACGSLRARGLAAIQDQGCRGHAQELPATGYGPGHPRD